MATNLNVGSFNNVQTLVPVFSGEDYDYWSLQMRTLFISQDLWELVDGGYDAPESVEALATWTHEKKREHKENTVKDAAALFFILQGVSKSIFPDLLEARCSKLAWDTLKNKFQLPCKKIRQPSNLGLTTILMDCALYMCIKDGKISKLKKIISQDVLSRERTCGENTALHVAVQYKRIDIVREIFNLCPSLVLEQNLKGDTALHLAARTGKQDIVKFLIERSDVEMGGERADKKLVRMANESMDTALHDAVRNHHLQVVKLLTEADPEYEYLPNANEETPLYLAVEDQLYDMVKQILEVCPSSSHSGPRGLTALQMAVNNNHSGMTELLLKNKPSLIKETNKVGNTALHYAASMDFSERVTQLLEFDRSVACISNKNGATPLHMASRYGSLSSLKEIIRLCPDSLEAITNEGNNFLHLAIKYKQYKVIEWILETNNMADDLVNETNNDGNTPLHLSAKSDRYRTAKKLIENETTNKRIMNKQGLTAMDISYSKGNPLLHCNLKQYGGASSRRKFFIRRKPVQDPWSQKTLQDTEQMSNIGLIVATLIATVTFTAGITLPGGFKGDGQDEGHAVLTKETTFRAFVISNTIAMFLSIYAVFIHFSTRFMKHVLYIGHLHLQAHLCTLGAILGMVVAFVTGSYSVLNNSVGLAIAVCVFCFIFFILVVCITLLWLKDHSQYPMIKWDMSSPLSVVPVVSFFFYIRRRLKGSRTV